MSNTINIIPCKIKHIYIRDGDPFINLNKELFLSELSNDHFVFFFCFVDIQRPLHSRVLALPSLYFTLPRPFWLWSYGVRSPRLYFQVPIPNTLLFHQRSEKPNQTESSLSFLNPLPTPMVHFVPFSFMAQGHLIPSMALARPLEQEQTNDFGWIKVILIDLQNLRRVNI